MTDCSITVTYLDTANNAHTKGIKQINPHADTDKLILWAKSMIAVTDNSYVSTAVIYKVKLD